MKTNEQRQAEFEEVKEQLILRALLFWAGIKAGFWRAFPHDHVFETRLVCLKCYRSMEDLFR